MRPAIITVNLYKQVGDKQPERIESKSVRSDKEGKWRWKFKELPRYEDGIEIVYTITEDEVEGYETEVNGYNVTNSHTPDKTSIQVTKAWKDANNQDGKRPDSVTIKLLADGKDTGKTIKIRTIWKDSF